MSRREGESQTAFAIRMVTESAVENERNRIMTALAEIDPIEWALAGSDALSAIVEPVVRRPQ